MTRPRPATGPVALVLAALLVVASACGGEGGDGALPAGETTSTSGPAAPGATSPPESPAPVPDGAPGTTRSGDPAAPPSTGTTARPPGSTAPTSSVVTASPPPPSGRVGSYAPFYLRDEESAGLVVEVHHQSGAAPAAATLEHLGSVLRREAAKPVRVATAALGGGARSWTPDDLRALADSTGAGQSRAEAVLELLFVHGDFEGQDVVLGVAVRSDVAAVFVDRVAAAAGLVGDPTAIEVAVTTHEVGHILGLVDLHLDTGRADPDHPGHSSNPESVMYYAVESDLLEGFLTGGPPRDFDQADRADLATIRGG